MSCPDVMWPREVLTRVPSLGTPHQPFQLRFQSSLYPTPWQALWCLCDRIGSGVGVQLCVSDSMGMEVFWVSRSPWEGVSFLEQGWDRREVWCWVVGLEGHSIPFSLYGERKTLAPLTPARFLHATLLSSFLCHMVGMAFLLPGGLSPTSWAWRARGSSASLWGPQHQVCMALA